MKSIISLYLIIPLYLFAFLISGCDKIPTGVIDNRDAGYHMTYFNAPAEIIYNTDSSFVTSLKIDNTSVISEVWMNISYPGGANIFEHINLLDNGDMKNGDSLKGDNVFSAKIFFSRTNINSEYRASYFVNAKGELSPVVIHTFRFYNGQVNYPPVISSLVMPDTVGAGDKFVFSVKASSPAGLNDIKRVFFKFIRQDGSVSDEYDMHDDGDNETFGDQNAGDGIYSFKNKFELSVQGQSRKFVFQAISRSDSLSNIITHNIYVK